MKLKKNISIMLVIGLMSSTLIGCSNTSSDAAFLDSLDCKIALISAGYKNKYDHPSTETLKTLDHLIIHTFCTNTNGSIAIYSLHHFAFVVTNDGLFGIIRA